MTLRDFLIKFFTWWNGATFGTLWAVHRYGVFVGEDEFGNRYYRTREVDPTIGTERRWVVYKGEAEPTAIPPGWHSWIHHRSDAPPTEQKYVPREWEKPPVPNLTGTPLAYRPRGSLLRPGEAKPMDPGAYEPWRPE